MNPLVPDFILMQETRGRTEGNFAAAALFIDIPGFTHLTTTLFREHFEQYKNFRKQQAGLEISQQERAEEILAGAL
ncbi:MAG TPA: hypothetical protein PK156_44360, partial [Polyangium sp.]|nr:hypothetical protein [Polyangium sp.]